MTREQARAIAERVAEYLISDEGGGFSDNLLMDDVLDGVADVILDAVIEYTNSKE